MKKFLRSIVGLLSLCLLTVSVFRPVSAQESGPTDDEVNAVASQLYCPVCENIPLDACGTVACEQWRGIIRDKLAQGWTEDEIKDYFVAQYGDRVLAEPPVQGFNWLAYLIPFMVLVGGLVLLVFGFRKWRVTESLQSTPPRRKTGLQDPEIDQEYLRKVEEELEARTRGRG